MIASFAGMVQVCRAAPDRMTARVKVGDRGLWEVLTGRELVWIADNVPDHTALYIDWVAVDGQVRLEPIAR